MGSTPLPPPDTPPGLVIIELDPVSPVPPAQLQPPETEPAPLARPPAPSPARPDETPDLPQTDQAPARISSEPAQPEITTSGADDNTAPNPSQGVGVVPPGAAQAVTRILCLDAERSRAPQEGCPRSDVPGPETNSLFVALPEAQQTKIDDVRVAQLANVTGYGNALEWYLERDTRPPAKIFGIDNSIFVEGRHQEAIDLDRLRMGLRPDWQDEVEKAHGRD
ncbi:MAG: hypothetical protein AAFX86_05180 [Pseudomonadota bacterium]